MRKTLLILLVLVGVNGFAQTVRTAVATSGNWGTNSTWDCNCAPATTDSIVIPSGKTVILNASKVCVGIEIAGNLSISSNTVSLTTRKNLKITSTGNIIGTGQGSLIMTPINSADYVSMIINKSSLTNTVFKIVINGTNSYLFANIGAVLSKIGFGSPSANLTIIGQNIIINNFTSNYIGDSLKIDNSILRLNSLIGFPSLYLYNNTKITYGDNSTSNNTRNMDLTGNCKVIYEGNNIITCDSVSVIEFYAGGIIESIGCDIYVLDSLINNSNFSSSSNTSYIITSTNNHNTYIYNTGNLDISFLSVGNTGYDSLNTGSLKLYNTGQFIVSNFLTNYGGNVDFKDQNVILNAMQDTKNSSFDFSGSTITFTNSLYPMTTCYILAKNILNFNNIVVDNAILFNQGSFNCPFTCNGTFSLINGASFTNECPQPPASSIKLLNSNNKFIYQNNKYIKL